MAKSKTGDYGLMQVNKIHGRYLDIDSNIKAGAEILESYFWIMRKEYPFNLPEALKKGLQAYNRGVAKVKKEILKEKLESEERELFYCERNFDCYLKKEVQRGKFSGESIK
jgi:membrane-bound lytic murein transglycosylase MltF